MTAVPVLTVAQQRQVRAERLRRLARSQHGVVSWHQLLSLSFNEQEIRTLVARGHLRRLYRGVYAVGPLAPTQAGWFSAAVLAIGAGAVLSHRSAAAHWEFLPARVPPVDVSVDRPVRSRRGIRVHEVRTLAGAETLRHRGIPITTPARTLLDLAASSLPDQGLQRAVHEAEVRRRVSVPALHRFLAEAKGRPGTKRLAAVIAPGPAPTRSAFEDRILALVDAHGLPRPRCNAHIHGVEVDFHWPEHGVVLEADGVRFHDTPVRRARDRAKQARLEARGQRVLRATWEQATGQPEQTVARLRGALADRPSGPH